MKIQKKYSKIQLSETKCGQVIERNGLYYLVIGDADEKWNGTGVVPVVDLCSGKVHTFSEKDEVELKKNAVLLTEGGEG